LTTLTESPTTKKLFKNIKRIRKTTEIKIGTTKRIAARLSVGKIEWTILLSISSATKRTEFGSKAA
jgi:hypothetical protein